MDFWLPIAGLSLLGAGLSYLLACKLFPKRPFLGACGVCGLEHGSNAAWDGNKQACIDALLAKMPKRGEHGRFAKRV